ncbi:MAG: prolipoprotein diacylglyceryl transferase family protein, partial [Phycisphaerales bacterium]
ESPVNSAERLATHAVVFIPWAAALAAAAVLPAPDAVESRTPWEASLPRFEWAVVAWALIPILVLAVPVIVRDRTDLRRFQSAGVSGVAFYLLLRLSVPLKTTPLPHADGGIISGTLSFIESWDPFGHAAFASWRVFWVCCGAAALGLSLARWRPVLWVCACALALSGLACGLASAVDLAAGFGLFIIAWHSQRLWLAVLRRLERVANAWVQFDVGPARVLVHAAYAGLAAATGMLVASVLAPPNLLPWLIALALAGLLGAGAWGLAMEGSKLSRPFGFFGHVFASSAVVAVCAAFEGDGAWRLGAAASVAACAAQAIGRLRCLVQGCCHGRPCEGLAGVHHEDPRSRVAKFTPWKGRSLYPTAAYSIVANVAMIPLLIRLFAVGAPASFVVGTYLTLGGLSRFVEEHFRGEPQTASHAGLRSYQWLAAVTAALGVLAMTFPAPALSAPAAAPAWFAAAIVGVIYAIAMGVEFPRSNRRLSRLS